MIDYVSGDYHITNEQFTKLVNEVTDKEFEWTDILKIDCYIYKSNKDYDGGLSFLNRLNNKLGRFHPEWNIEGFKQTIRLADSPQDTFILVVSSMLSDPRDVHYYGF
jgi:hypothetical protein